MSKITQRAIKRGAKQLEAERRKIMGLLMGRTMRFPLGGAVVFPEIKVVEVDGKPGWEMPKKANEEYKVGMVTADGTSWASKDGKKYCLAIALFLPSGEKVTNAMIIATLRHTRGTEEYDTVKKEFEKL